MEIKGKYGTANVFASIVDDETKKQIKNLMNQKFIKDTYVSIMADCHAGKGCVIGTTMKITNNCVPSLVGVDIGCGMITVNLKKMDINLIKLDRFIRKKIPFGNDVRNETIKSNVDITKLYAYNSLKHKDRIEKSLGTLGGGNHFIEIDKDDDENNYLIIHTGSRNLGKQVCEYYIDLAYLDYKAKYEKARDSLVKRYKRLNKEAKINEGLDKLKKRYEIEKELIPLYGKSFQKYLHDMKICQEFALENRIEIAKEIMDFLGYSLNDFEYFQTIHNYINMDDLILRKGAISAYSNEVVLIPINMKDGAIIAKGKSNEKYNYSAPHGAGRVLSRKQANEMISLDDFKKAMSGIYSTSVQIDTIDESPFAYKSIDDILPNIVDTVDVIKIIKPIYNFKATYKRGR